MTSYTIYNSPDLFHYPPLTLEDEHTAYQEVLRYEEARVNALQQLEHIRTLLASPMTSPDMKESLLYRELAVQQAAKLVSSCQIADRYHSTLTKLYVLVACRPRSTEVFYPLPSFPHRLLFAVAVEYRRFLEEIASKTFLPKGNNMNIKLNFAHVTT